MRVIAADEIDARLAYPQLVDDLEAAFRLGAIAPPRHHHTLKLNSGQPDATLLLMPAWSASTAGSDVAGRYLGLKSVTVFPGNGARGLPAVQGVYLLLSAETGAPLALIDGPRLTAWRTAAASALACRWLARPDATRLLLIGAGALGEFLIRAHASVRPIREVAIWNRTRSHAEALAARLAGRGAAGSDLTITVADDLAEAVSRADIVSTATLSATPLIEGRWLAPGTHLDCVGAFRPDMRETDDEVVRRARIWVDTRAGAATEAGDIVIPLRSGVIDSAKIEGDLHELARGEAPRRTSATDITMFKSVGASIEDLAAAIAVYERSAQS